MKGTLWCLHGAVGQAGDWQGFGVPEWGVKRVDLWRFLDCCPMTMPEFGRALNAEAAGAADGRWQMVDGRWKAPCPRDGSSVAGVNGRWQMADGGSEPEMPDPSLRDLPSTIYHPPPVLRSLGEGGSTITRRVLVGYSMGARLALHALLDGGPWDAVVLVAPHPGLESELERAARRESDAEWAGRALTGDWREFLTLWNAQAVLADSGRLPSVSDLRRREVARSFMDWSLGAQEPLWERLGEIQCPVLWCAGERDVKFRALAERALPLLPRGELWVAPGAGHRVPWDAPEAFAAKVGEFLERVRS